MDRTLTEHPYTRNIWAGNFRAGLRGAGCPPRGGDRAGPRETRRWPRLLSHISAEAVCCPAVTTPREPRRSPRRGPPGDRPRGGRPGGRPGGGRPSGRRDDVGPREPVVDDRPPVLRSIQKVRTPHGTRVARRITCTVCGAGDTIDFAPRDPSEVLCRKCAFAKRGRARSGRRRGPHAPADVSAVQARVRARRGPGRPARLPPAPVQRLQARRGDAAARPRQGRHTRVGQGRALAPAAQARRLRSPVV
jgi:hypothetical protein